MRLTRSDRPEVMKKNSRIIKDNAIYILAVNTLKNARIHAHDGIKQTSEGVRKLASMFAGKQPDEAKKNAIELEREKEEKQKKQDTITRTQ